MIGSDVVCRVAIDYKLDKGFYRQIDPNYAN